jgi:hypothetical protein
MFDGVTDIVGAMIGHRLPPWLSYPCIFETLNAAAKGLSGPRVTFRADRVEGDPPMFIAVAP